MTKKKYRSFEQARKFARSQKFQNREEWKNFVKSGKLPDDIPRGPAGVYKNKGWKGWGDWLGTGYVSTRNLKYRTFKEARKFVQTINFKSTKEWKKFYKSGKLPDDIPKMPQNSYKNKGWVNWGDWLGTGQKFSKINKKIRTYEKAREFVHTLNLKSSKEWIRFTRSGKLPDDIPTNPRYEYKNKGWKGMGDWLGTGNISQKEKSESYLPPQEAKPIIQKLAEEYGLKNRKDWTRFAKTHKKLLQKLHIPADPVAIYSLKRAKKRMMK